MKLSQEKQGELFIFIETTLWSLFPVITVLTLKSLSPFISLGFSTLFACLFFAIVLTIKRKWKELTNRSAFYDILIATGLLGILFYIFYFFGLRYTSPGNASIIALSETFFSYIFFNVWRKEELSRFHIIGASLAIFGVLIIFYPSLHGFYIGDLLILAAAFIAPFGNFFQRRARTKVSSESILFIRSSISTVVILFLAYLFHAPFSYVNLSNDFLVLFLNGVFLLGFSKIMWIEGIHRINVTKANALASISPLLTILFAWLLLQKSPTIYQLLAFIPMFLGVLFLTKTKK